jgi:hypothetical protein
MKEFSIRDLLFAIIIVSLALALALGWWHDRRPVPARFQMQVSDSGHVYILDTATGEMTVWPSGATSGPRL